MSSESREERLGSFVVLTQAGGYSAQGSLRISPD